MASFELSAIPHYGVFREVIEQNIGQFPAFSFDAGGLSGHRIRLFDDPLVAEIQLSVRALARHQRLADLVHLALEGKDGQLLADGLCAEAGGAFICSNKFQGLALIAHAFSRIGIERLTADGSMNALLERARGGNALALVEVLLPLGHEIGHLPSAQKYCPPAILGNEFLDTYRINYERTHPFVGEFDYERSLQEESSPLNLNVLRQEVAADYFATCAVATMFAKTVIGRPFPIAELTYGLLSFPMIMTMEEMCAPRGHSVREVQELALAMQCRNSVLVDSVRACVKSFFADSKSPTEAFNIIDQAIDRHDGLVFAMQPQIWHAIRAYAELTDSVASLSASQVLDLALKQTPDVQQQLSVARYISVVLDELGAFPLSVENEQALRAYRNALSTFDTVVIHDNAVQLVRGPAPSPRHSK